MRGGFRDQIKAITDGRVAIVQDGKGIHLPNDAVIVNAGGVLPNEFLKKMGIEVVTKWGEA